MSDITLIDGLLLINRIPWRNKQGRLYYFEGNFYYPFLSLDGCEVGRVKRAIREFTKNNLDLIARDRAAPGHKTILELFDIQEEEFAQSV